MRALFQLILILLVLLFTSLKGIAQEFFQKLGTVTQFQGSDTLTRYNFNPVLSFSDVAKLERVQKGKFQKSGSLFFAFESMQEAEVNVLTMKDSKNSITITSKHVLFSDGVENKVEPLYGSILSYQFSRDSYGRKNNELKIAKEFISQEGNLLEFIYIPDVVTPLDQAKIESYLSLKYGISLYQTSYIATSNDTIWDYEDNKGFSHRVTGIGRDDQIGLYQRKSVNSELKAISIGVDSLHTIGNYNYLIWSDNDGVTTIQESTYLKRKWHVHYFGEEDYFENLQLTVDPNLLFEQYDHRLETTSDVMWLVLCKTSDFTSEKEFIKYTKKENEKFVFEQINFSEYPYFTFLIAPEFFVEKELVLSICEETNQLRATPIGGVAPYQLKLSSAQFKDEFQFNESDYIQSNLTPGDYFLEVTDQLTNYYSTTFTISKNNSFTLDLKETWVLLDDNEIIIFPQLSETSQVLSYEWLSGNEVIASTSSFKTSQAGDYLLKVTLVNGCIETRPFKVVFQDVLTNQISIYPNSTASGDYFYVDFHLSEPKDVSISIHDMAGKIILNEQLSTIQDFQFKTFLTVTGIYLLTVSTDKVVVAKRIIVK